MTELLITSSVLITAIVLVRAALKNRVSARLIYALWLVAALRLMLPFELYPSQVSVMNAAPDAVLAGTVDIYEPQSAVTQNQYLYTDPEPAENQAPVDGTSQNLGSAQTNTAPAVPEQTTDHETAINSAHLLSAQIDEATSLNEQLRVQRSVLSSNSRISRIASQNYGMVLTSDAVTIDLGSEGDATADGEAAQTADAGAAQAELS